jgi:hypothetical protein
VVYQLQVSANSVFSALAIDRDDLTEPEYSGAYSFISGATYYWRVRAKDGLGNWGIWSPAWSYGINMTGLDAPRLTAPLNGVATADNRPSFVWEAIPGAVKYQLHVSTSPGFETLANERHDLTGTSFRPVLAMKDGVYYWRMRANDVAGNWGSWSETWKVTIKTIGPLAPALISPANGATVSNTLPAFNWETTTEAIVYQLQVSTNSGFATRTIDRDDLAATEYSATQNLSEGAT